MKQSKHLKFCFKKNQLNLLTNFLYSGLCLLREDLLRDKTPCTEILKMSQFKC